MAKKNEIAKSEEYLPGKFDYGDDVDGGFENQTQEDRALPWLTLLQELSPQVKKGEHNIEGAEPGMFCNTLTKEIFPDGVEIVIASTEHVFCEWKPKMGGFVGRRSLNDPEIVRVRREQEFGKYTSKDGNDLIETFYIYGAIAKEGADPEPFIMGITGTKIKAYKQFMQRAKMFRHGPERQKAPLYAHRVLVTSFEDRRGNNDFWNISLRGAVGDKLENGLLEPSDPRFLAAKALSREVISGDAKVDYDAQQPDSAGETEHDVF